MQSLFRWHEGEVDVCRVGLAARHGTAWGKLWAGISVMCCMCDIILLRMTPKALFPGIVVVFLTLPPLVGDINHCSCARWGKQLVCFSHANRACAWWGVNSGVSFAAVYFTAIVNNNHAAKQSFGMNPKNMSGYLIAYIFSMATKNTQTVYRKPADGYCWLRREESGCF